MKNLRIHGKEPYSVAVIHGGPGARGEMTPVARELASVRGVLEPLQTETSVEGQVLELKTVLEENGNLPVTLVGFSWGAWLGFILAAQYPSFVGKLILVGSGPFEERYAAGIQEIRLNRLSKEERAEVQSLMSVLKNPEETDKITALTRFGALYAKADAYDPISCETDESDVVDCQVDIFQGVWKEAAELRRSGVLLAFGKQINCPVVAIHGEYDPHSAAGVQEPLSTILKSFRFCLLGDCGHRPWIERHARGEFYRVLHEELQDRG